MACSKSVIYVDILIVKTSEGKQIKTPFSSSFVRASTYCLSGGWCLMHGYWLTKHGGHFEGGREGGTGA